MTEVSKEEVERRAMEAARRLLTTPKPSRAANKASEPAPAARKPRGPARGKPSSS